MFVVKDEQLRTLKGAAVGRSEDRIVAHVQRVFPYEAGVLGTGTLRTLARRGANECAKAGIARERDVALYVDLLVGLGRDFRSDPANAWIVQILDASEVPGPDKIERIYRRLQAPPPTADGPPVPA